MKRVRIARLLAAVTALALALSPATAALGEDVVLPLQPPAEGGQAVGPESGSDPASEGGDEASAGSEGASQGADASPAPAAPIADGSGFDGANAAAAAGSAAAGAAPDDGGSSDAPLLALEAHVQDLGWMDPVSAGDGVACAGTTGRGLGLEALRFQLDSSDGSDVLVAAHVSNVGWMEEVHAGEVAGTVGRGLPMEAVRISLSGPISEQYDIWYRVHSADYGWGGWASNGSAAGTQGLSKAAQAVQVLLLPKGSSAPGSTADAFRSYAVAYTAHVQDVGWQSRVADGETAGTVGRNLNLEAISVSLGGYAGSGSVEARAHVQNLGWQGWTSGQVGTTGRNLAIEALQFRLTGAAAERFDIWYRVHSADFGWGGWACNGASAGSQGYAKAAQAVEIVLVEKGGAAPGGTDDAFRVPTAQYGAHVSGVGWIGGRADDGDPDILIGTTGQSRALEAFTLSLPGLGDGSVSYEAHVSEIGWQASVSDGATAGTTGRGLPIEAVRISLSGGLADAYDIWYRAHIAEIGWMGWASDGEPAGSEGLASHLEAIEVRLVPKGGEAPGSGLAFLTKPTVTYSACSVGTGWGGDVSNGGTAGVTGQGRAVEAIRVSFAGCVDGGVSYRVHLADVGWQDPVAGGDAGAAGGGKDVQAVSVSLTGDAARYFDVWYRVHVEDYGWLGWAKNGADAGTTKLGLQVEAVEITVTGKGAAAPGPTAPFTS